MVAAMLASAAGAVIAIVLSLFLRSPDAIFANSVTVAIGAVAAGLGAGVLWRMLGQAPGQLRRFEVAIGTAFALIVVLLLASEQVLDRMTSFGLPLAAVVLGAVAVGTPLLARRRLPGWSGGSAMVAVLGLGAALVSVRFEQRSALVLPPVTSAAAVDTAAEQPGGSPAANAGLFRTPSDVQGVTFAVAPGSEAHFTVREQLRNLTLPNDATMRNTALTGTVRLDGQPSVFQLDLRQFQSDQRQRDQFIRQQWSAQPIATVTIASIGALPTQYVAGDVIKRQVSGKLTIMGFEGPITLDIEARMDSDQLSLLGHTTFRWSDYQMRPPNTPNVQVQDQVAVEVLLLAKATQ